MVVQILDVQISALDVLSFRSPRPFGLGGYAETERMPPPGTVALAFTAQLYLKKVLAAASFEDLLKKIEERGAFHGPVLSRQGRLYVPAPLDMAECPKCDKVFFSRWLVSPEGRLEGPWPVHTCGYAGKPLRSFLVPLSKAARREVDELVKLDKVLKVDVRPGVCLDDFKTARPGFFHQAEWVEVGSGWSLRTFITVKDNDFGRAVSEVRMLRLGRKGRPVEVRDVGKLDFEGYYRLLTGLEASEAALEIARGGLFDLVLITPGIFLRGDACTSEPPDGLIPDAELIGVATDRPSIASGWDFSRSAPRAMYWAAPAGTVYRYRLKRYLVANEVRDRVIGTVLLENVGVWSAIGYGTAVVVPPRLGGD
ncbi:MAG: hypothetical protein N3H31_07465 [Candidatus Nezhaarchaeota archaeon]|nr:hypothetical protein [Candidatus Nezhaarchaeota archaeon]